MSHDTKILGVLNGKGGVGKTTTAINLAATFSGVARVLLVDADPQGSATWWAGRNDDGMGFDVVKETQPKKLKQLNNHENYQVIVIDTPPHLNSKTLATIVPVSDYLILPTPAAPMDLAALIETVKTLVKPTSITYRVLLTRVDPRSTGVAMEAQETLRTLDIPVFSTFIRAYKAHEQAALEGVAITQWKGKHARAAQSDYRLVADELQQDWRN
ncbi:MAG: ParA family protein [Merismopedia sp. SIO2A8]|nr:ParA family protein [Symploca sp. SIO2B6]NET52933.1 ParA family protein [Merismopedia sp. SIO2A8]